MKTKVLIGIVILVVVASVAYAKYFRGKQQPRELTVLKVALSWLHNSQFAGLYWADQKGLYEEEGLSVELAPYQLDENLAQALVAEKYDLVIMQTDTLLQAREKGLKVKAIFADYQLMPTCYYSKKEANISRPEDLIGKTVGVAYSERYPLVAMLRNKGVDISQVNIVDRGYDYQALADGSLDVEAGWITDGDTVQAVIGAYNVIHPYDYGVNWYADLIVTTEDMTTKENELVGAFMRATKRGWEMALVNSDEAALLTQRYDPDKDAEHLKFVWRVSSPLIYTGQGYIGNMEESVFKQAQEFLLDQGIIGERGDVRGAYTLEFLGNAPDLSGNDGKGRSVELDQTQTKRKRTN